jgi:hypothetical protein
MARFFVHHLWIRTTGEMDTTQLVIPRGNSFPEFPGKSVCISESREKSVEKSGRTIKIKVENKSRKFEVDISGTRDRSASRSISQELCEFVALSAANG